MPTTNEDRWAKAEGRTSPLCDIREIVQAELNFAKTPSRAWVVQWLLQQPLEAFLPLGAAFLLLRLVAHVNTKSGTAWIGRRTLAAMTGQHRHTVDAHARALTAPWGIRGDRTRFPPLFRVSVRGWGRRRSVHWEPLEAGWVPFINLLHTAATEIRAEVHGNRAPTPHKDRE